MANYPTATLAFGYNLGDSNNRELWTNLSGEVDEYDDPAPLPWMLDADGEAASMYRYDELIYDELAREVPDRLDGEDAEDAVKRAFAIEVISHAYEYSGVALVATGTKVRTGLSDVGVIDPEHLRRVDVHTVNRLMHAVARLGLAFPQQPDGPGWLLLPSYG